MRIPRATRVGRGLLLGATALAACSESHPTPQEPAGAASPADTAATPATPRPSVVLVVLDDVGTDLLRSFQSEAEAAALAPPCTPNLDALAARGLSFRHVWTNPVCSPSRAQLLTGRHAFRTGIGKGIGVRKGGTLRVDLETTVPDVLTGYAASAVGKWHLVSLADGGLSHPLEAGFGYYAGSLYNLAEDAELEAPCRAKGPTSYLNWLKTADYEGHGTLTSRCSDVYATTDTTDEAIGRVRAMRAPWFLYVAYNAPHWPLLDPPPALCPAPDACPEVFCGGPRPRERSFRLRAMLEALDHELGRLLDELRARAPEAYVFVIGDNGTDQALLHTREEVQEGGDDLRGKATLFESGVHVPLIVAGPGVVPGACDALVSSTDLFATFAELAGVESHAEDSVSLVPYLRGSREPRRRTVYAEVFTPNQPDAELRQPFAPTHHERALRDRRYKLVRLTTPEEDRESFYDLEDDPEEARPLLAGNAGTLETDGLAAEARAHYRALHEELAGMGMD